MEDIEDAQIADLLVWETVVEDGAQLGQRRAARSLIIGPDGAAQATDEEIETGQFKINIEKEWWPVLEMEPADIQLTEPNDG